MLNIMDSNYRKKSNINFGSNLIVGQGVTDQLSKHPEDLKQIQDFKEYLAKDGKNWNAELTYDTFASAKKTPEETENLIKKSAQNWDYRTCIAASNSISEMEPQYAAGLIKKMANDPDEKIQTEAASKAGKIKDAKIAASLIDEFANYKDPKISREAVSSIENIKDSSVRKQMIEKYAANENEDIRCAAIGAADFDDIKDSIEKYSQDSSADVRGSVIRKIRDLDNEEYDENAQLFDPIVEKMTRDEDKYVASCAIEAAAKMDDSQKAVNLINDFVNNTDSGWEKYSAIRSLSDLKDKNIAKNTIENFLNNPDYNIQESASSAAVNIKDAEIQNYFVDKLLKNENPEIRENVAEGYDKIENTKHLSKVAETLLNDSAPKVRETAARHIGLIEDTKTRDSLIEKYIINGKFEIKKGILDTIDEIDKSDHEKALKYAQVLANDNDKNIQKEANELLDELNTENQKDHYNLKITDGDKALDQKQVMATRYGERNIFKSFFNAYKAIFENNAQ